MGTRRDEEHKAPASRGAHDDQSDQSERSADEAVLTEALFRAPLADFVLERKRAAQLLMRDGQRDAALRIKARTKPSVAAWVANQLFHDEPEAWRAAIEAGASLRAAQQEGGRSGDEMRATMATQRDAVRRLMQRGEALARARGQRLNAAHVRKLKDTLDALVAGASDAEAGRLEGELTPPSFDALDLTAMLAARPPRSDTLAASASAREVTCATDTTGATDTGGTAGTTDATSRAPAVRGQQAGLGRASPATPASPTDSAGPAPAMPTKPALPQQPPRPDPARVQQARMALQAARSRRDAARTQEAHAQTRRARALQQLEQARAEVGVAERRLAQARADLDARSTGLSQREDAVHDATDARREAEAAVGAAERALEALQRR